MRKGESLCLCEQECKYIRTISVQKVWLIGYTKKQGAGVMNFSRVLQHFSSCALQDLCACSVSKSCSVTTQKITPGGAQTRNATSAAQIVKSGGRKAGIGDFAGS